MLHYQFLCHVSKALFFTKIALKLSYFFAKKNAKFLSAGGSPPEPLNSPPTIADFWLRACNLRLLQKKLTPARPPTLCNCRTNTSCPFNGECCSKSLLYKAELTCDNVIKYYYGLCKTIFKTRCNNHKYTFRQQDEHHLTELSKAHWNAIETAKYPNVKWNTEKQAQPYQNGSNRCNLCLEENNAILQYKQTRLTPSTKELNLYQNVNTKPSIN